MNLELGGVLYRQADKGQQASSAEELFELPNARTMRAIRKKVESWLKRYREDLVTGYQKGGVVTATRIPESTLLAIRLIVEPSQPDTHFSFQYDQETQRLIPVSNPLPENTR